MTFYWLFFGYVLIVVVLTWLAGRALTRRFNIWAGIAGGAIVLVIVAAGVPFGVLAYQCTQVPGGECFRFGGSR